MPASIRPSPGPWPVSVRCVVAAFPRRVFYRFGGGSSACHCKDGTQARFSDSVARPGADLAYTFGFASCPVSETLPRTFVCTFAALSVRVCMCLHLQHKSCTCNGGFHFAPVNDAAPLRRPSGSGACSSGFPPMSRSLRLRIS